MATDRHSRNGRIRTRATSVLLALLMALAVVGVEGIASPAVAAAASSRARASAVTCEQAPAQSVKDRATYTPAELARYGLPPRTPGEPYAKWAEIVRSAGKRVCTHSAGTAQFGEANSAAWDGNYADESTSGQVYTEADMDYYVSCIASDDHYSTYAAWIGIGGVTPTSGHSLVQAGTSGTEDFSVVHGWESNYYAFVENFGDTADPGPHNEFPVNCGDHMYVKAWDSGSTGCMYVERISDGENSGNQCYGPKSDEHSGEAIVEYNASEPDFAKIGTETFYGVGITDNGSYKAMNNLPHDYANLYHCYTMRSGACTDWGDQLASTGPIQNDPGDVPYDQYAVTWKNYN